MGYVSAAWVGGSPRRARRSGARTHTGDRQAHRTFREVLGKFCSSRWRLGKAAGRFRGRRYCRFYDSILPCNNQF